MFSHKGVEINNSKLLYMDIRNEQLSKWMADGRSQISHTAVMLIYK